MWQYLTPLQGTPPPKCHYIADPPHDAVQNRISPSWETIDAKWHIFLMLCNPLHWVNIVEVRGVAAQACAPQRQRNCLSADINVESAVGVLRFVNQSRLPVYPCMSEPS